MKAKNFIVPLVIYPFDVMVSLNENYDQFADAVTKRWGSEILEDFKKYERPTQAGLSYVYTSEMCLCCIVKMMHFKKDGNGIGTLCHEIFHTTEFVLRKCNLSLNESSHEAYAYLHGYLMQEIYKKL